MRERSKFINNQMITRNHNLDKYTAQAGRMFPPYGETAEIKEAETLKRIKKILEEAM